MQVLQRRTTTRIDRPNAADRAAESTLAQPARHREKAGKLQPPAVQRWVSLQLEQILLMNEGKLGSRSAVIALIS